ncbi:MAG TPA: MmcQ/YjbR family DNA-binding protein [Chthoniobacterales bacterium]
MTATQFRRTALSLPEAVESAHMHHPDFRVKGRIFATLGYPNNNSAVVKLTPEQQKRFVRNAGRVFQPVTGAWGRRGYTHVNLVAAKIDNIREALAVAWRNTAPKRLVSASDSQAAHAAE